MGCDFLPMRCALDDQVNCSWQGKTEVHCLGFQLCYENTLNFIEKLIISAGLTKQNKQGLASISGLSEVRLTCILNTCVFYNMCAPYLGPAHSSGESLLLF